MGMKRIAIDLDGVLAEWNKPFAELLHAEGAKVPSWKPFEDPAKWHWPQTVATQAQVDAAWANANDVWWQALPLHNDVTACDAHGMEVRHLVQKLSALAEVSFVTARPCGRAASIAWLTSKLGLIAPQVIHERQGDKAVLLAQMCLDMVIEDKADTLAQWTETEHFRGRRPLAVLVNRSYNQGEYPGVLRVPSTLAALRVVERGLDTR